MALNNGWNIIVCGDFEKPLLVHVNPSKKTIAHLKGNICRRMNIPESESSNLTLYCNEQELPEEKLLQDCAGLRNGVGVLAAIKPFVINVYSPDRDASLRIEIPKRELKDWKIHVSSLLKLIHFRYAFLNCEHDILAVNGRVIDDESLKITEVVWHDCLMTYTRMSQFYIPSTDDCIGGRSVLLPSATKEAFASTHGIFGRKVNSLRHYPWGDFWTVTLQKFDGTKTPLTFPNPANFPIFNLREAVKDVVSVPPQQQKLVLGETVLEDWDNEGEALLVTHYPGFYDGVTLYLIQLTDGIRVTYDYKHKNIRHSERNLSYYTPCSSFSPRTSYYTPSSSHGLIMAPEYINIPSPTHFKINLLGAILQHCLDIERCNCNIFSLFDEKEQCNCKLFVCSSTANNFVLCSNKPVSSVEWITDGCTLTLRRPAPRQKTQ